MGYSDKVQDESQQPSEAEEPAVLEGDRDGDGELSEFEKQVLAKNAVRDYVMPDGSVIQLDPTEPTPAEVKAVLGKEAQPIAELFTSAYDNVTRPAMEKMRTLAEAQAKAIGRPVVIVYSRPDPSGSTIWVNLASGKKSTGLSSETSKESMTAKAQSWATNMGYEMIVTS